ncbi:MAG: lipid II:glycine glycyltransferase FemX [Patescibacteria group bacterium]|jgi:lipid II:glycine glycyltransferase (peptidoglycan interpeptide bridge formation enzyme)
MSNLSIQLIEDKARWEIFILKRPEANFLQSWNWGKFHKRLGKNVFRMALFEDEELAGAVQCIKEIAKRGIYLTLPGGPIINWEKPDHVKFIFSKIKELARSEGCTFIRMRPQIHDTQKNRQLLEQYGWKLAPMHLTADLTLQLDLSLSEEKLLAQMRKNTRYEIRKAVKEGIVVKQSQDPNDIEEFNKHQKELAKKHSFVPFSYEYLHEQFKSFLVDNQVILFHAYKENTLLASAFVIFYNKEAVYHYGISTPENQKFPGAYACQWKAIREAKKRGMKRYNFWGISPEDQPDHRFAGVSLFKRGFGGKEISYLPAHDLPVDWKYQVIKGFEMLRKKARKL